MVASGSTSPAEKCEPFIPSLTFECTCGRVLTPLRPPGSTFPFPWSGPGILAIAIPDSFIPVFLYLPQYLAPKRLTLTSHSGNSAALQITPFPLGSGIFFTERVFQTLLYLLLQVKNVNIAFSGWASAGDDDDVNKNNNIFWVFKMCQAL